MLSNCIQGRGVMSRCLIACALLASTVGAACATDDEVLTENVARGAAEISVDARGLTPFDITRVEIETDGIIQELRFNPATQTFDGTLLLTDGAHLVIARAFSGADVVAISAQTPVIITAATVSRVSLRLIDQGPEAPPLFGPIIDALSFPTTAIANQQSVFFVSALAPAGDPIAYSWTSDCPDATFAFPESFSTGWTKTAPGACNVQVAVSAAGFSIVQGFHIVVLPEGANIGALDVDAGVVTKPELQFALQSLGCFVGFGNNPNGSCTTTTLASPATSDFGVSVISWGGSQPGFLELFDNCGGQFGFNFLDASSASGNWRPPVAGGLYILTARATSAEGLTRSVSMAVLTRPGTPLPTQRPSVSVSISDGCFMTDLAFGEPVFCGFPFPGTSRTVFGSVDWRDGTPGAVEIFDDCGGFVEQPNNVFSFATLYQLPFTFGRTCNLTLRATNLQGQVTTMGARYQL